MALGTFTITLDADRLGGEAETTAKVLIRPQGGDYIRDPDTGTVHFKPLEKTVALPWSMDLPTDVASGGGTSTTVGFIADVRTQTGARLHAQFLARAAGSTLNLGTVADATEAPSADLTDTAFAARINDTTSQTSTALSASIDQRTNATVPGLVTTSLAADSTPADAAAAAVNTALDTSPRIPTVVGDDGSNDAHVFRTKLGRRFLGKFTRQGWFSPARGVLLGTATVAGGTDSAYAAATTLPGAATQAHRYLTEHAINADGTVPSWVLTRWASRLPGVNSAKARGIVCRGDSLTAGAYGSGTSYPEHLSTLCPGVPIVKRGAPGEKAKEISMRQGSTPLATTSLVTIPASGGVTVPMTTTTMFTSPDATNGVPDGTALVGSLNGIKGTLTITGGVFTFTRAAAGAAYDVPSGTPWLDDFESTHRDWNQIIWAGRNNVTATPSDVTTYVAAMAAYRLGGDYIVVSVTNATSEPSGSANYTTIQGINANLSAAHGSRYYDLRGYLISSGLAAVGLTATAGDTTAISEDRIPPSLLAADGLHLNSDGYKAAAIGIRAFINARGWL